MKDLSVRHPLAVQRALDLALIQACRNKSKSGIERLINEGAKPDCRLKSGVPLIHWAALNTTDDTTVLEELLKHGAPVDFNQGEDGWQMTTLHRAAKRGNSNACQLLIEHGANIHARDRYGHQPIHAATSSYVKFESAATKSACILIEAGADINSISNMGTTPLMFSAKAGWTNLFRKLLDMGAEYDTNAVMAIELSKAMNESRCEDNLKAILQSKMAQDAILKLLNPKSNQFKQNSI